MLKLKLVLLLLPLFFLFSCREKTLDLHIAPNKPKIVMLANWKAGDSLSVRLLRSLDPFGKVPEDIALTNPLIQIRKDGNPVEAEITNLGDGLYSSNVLLEPSHTYQVLVEHAEYPRAASPALFIPEVAPSQIAVNRTKNVQGPLFTATEDLYEIDVSQLKLSAQYCYTVTFKVFFRHGTRAEDWLANDFAALNDEACYARDRVEQQGFNYRYWLVSPACLNESRQTLKLYIGTSDNVLQGDRLLPVYTEKVQLKVGIANTEWLSFAQVNNAQPEGIDLLVMSPKLYKSNITGGYGMVTILNEAVFEYEY